MRGDRPILLCWKQDIQHRPSRRRDEQRRPIVTRVVLDHREGARASAGSADVCDERLWPPEHEFLSFARPNHPRTAEMNDGRLRRTSGKLKKSIEIGALCDL